jgi:hypothetical protein
VPGIFDRIILFKKMKMVYGVLTPLSTIYRSVLLVEKTGILGGEKPLICRKSLTNFIT